MCKVTHIYSYVGLVTRCEDKPHHAGKDLSDLTQHRGNWLIKNSLPPTATMAPWA